MPKTPFDSITTPEQDANDADRYRFLTMFNKDSEVLEKLNPHITPWFEQWEGREAHDAGDVEATNIFIDKLRDTAIGLKLWWPI